MSGLRRLACVLGGAAAAGLLTYWVIGFVGHWFETTIARNDSDLSLAYVVYLLMLALGTAFGAWAGNRLDRRR